MIIKRLSYRINQNQPAMKKIFLHLLIVTISGCEAGPAIFKDILDDRNRCNEYSVSYHTTNTNNCENTSPTKVYLTSEEFQRLYDIVSNEPQNCVFVSIAPKDGSPIRTGYIKNLESLIKITLNADEGQCN